MTARLREWASRVWGAFRPDQVDRELQEELRQHLEFAAEDARRRRRLSKRDVRAMRLHAGGVTQAMEAVRAQRGLPAFESVLRDVRYGVRQLARNPAFTMAAAGTLALAIGANTAMFSVLNAVLLRPLPYRSPEQLAMLWTENPAQNIREGRSALWDAEQWRAQSQSFADIATFDGTSRTLTGADGAEQAAGASISPNLLPLLGVQPVEGRSFSTEEVEQGQRLVLISHRFWQARFGGVRDALGATLVLDGLPHQIIGILPADFQVAGFDADVWGAHASRQSVRGREMWFVVGRLRPAMTFNQAQAEMSAIANRLNDRLPVVDRNRGIGVVPLSLYLVGPRSRLALWMLGGTVFCVFLIAAANVTSLSLARSAARTQEMALRAALGASAGRIVRQLLTENILLAVFSGLMGTVLALAGIHLIRAFGPANLPRLNEVSLDPRALGWAVGISLLAGILVGLPSAMTTLRRDLRHSGAEGGRSVSGGVATRRIRRALVVAELALAIVLLVGAGLFVRSWWNVTNLDSGFRPERVLMMELSTPTTLQAATPREAISTSAQRIDLYHRVLEEIQAVPGVESAGLTGDLFIDNDRVQVVTVERGDGMVSERLQFVAGEASADFFKAMGTPLLQGRFFSIGDGPDAPPVAIINEAMARRSWPGPDPVGKRFKLGPRDSDNAWYTVVGVVANMRRQGPEREPFPQMFVSFTESPPQSADLFIRTSSDDPLAMAGALRAAVRRVANDAPIYGVAPLEQRLGTYVAQRRFQTSLLTGFSIAALLIAAVGIYGLIQYSVATRTQEIGLRMAIGAQAGDIFRMIVGEGLMLSLTGVAIGLVGAWWLGRAGSSLLFGVTGGDPLTFTTVSLLLTAVAIAACYFPARRAMKVDPIRALRVT
jgi:putative ABC transport system permease protein